jgi:hypothetical protein
MQSSVTSMNEQRQPSPLQWRRPGDSWMSSQGNAYDEFLLRRMRAMTNDVMGVSHEYTRGCTDRTIGQSPDEIFFRRTYRHNLVPCVLKSIVEMLRHRYDMSVFQTDDDRALDEPNSGDHHWFLAGACV